MFFNYNLLPKQMFVGQKFYPRGIKFFHNFLNVNIAERLIADIHGLKLSWIVRDTLTDFFLSV